MVAVFVYWRWDRSSGRDDMQKTTGNLELGTDTTFYNAVALSVIAHGLRGSEIGGVR